MKTKVFECDDEKLINKCKYLQNVLVYNILHTLEIFTASLSTFIKNNICFDEIESDKFSHVFLVTRTERLTLKGYNYKNNYLFLLLYSKYHVI